MRQIFFQKNNFRRPCRSRFYISRRRDAFTLVEMMIALVIASVLAIAAFSFTQVTRSAGRSTTAVADFYRLADMVQSFIQIPDICDRMFKISTVEAQFNVRPYPDRLSFSNPAPLNNINPNVLVGDTDLPIIEVGSIFGALRVTQLQLWMGPQAAGGATEVIATVLPSNIPRPYDISVGSARTMPYENREIHRAVLTIAGVHQAGDALGGSGTYTREIPFLIVTDSTDSNRMKSCYRSLAAHEGTASY